MNKTENIVTKPLTKQDKKDLINKRLAEGDKRSYNEVAADLELELWGERFGSNIDKKRKVK